MNVLQLRKGALYFLLVTFTSYVVIPGYVISRSLRQREYDLDCMLFQIELPPAAGGRVPGSAKLVRKSLQLSNRYQNVVSIV